MEGIDDSNKQIVTQDYYTDSNGKIPRYYQLVAINRIIEAIARGQNRILLVMATGTGETFTAFQIIWRLWKSRKKMRILYLADRNILIDQTKTNDFKPFGSAMTKIENRNADKSYEIYLSLYQAVSGSEEWRNIYKQFSPDFFDLVIVDECHRGSAAEESAWREILEYFSSATQIGMTATPKETKDVSNIHYFGEPIYTYSLKQGIDDGFLAPYKVVRIDLDKDVSITVTGINIDKTAPAIDLVTIYPANTTAGSTINITVRSSDNPGVVEVTANGGASFTNNSGVWDGSIKAAPAVGTYDVVLRAKDAAGNEAQTMVKYTVVNRVGGIAITSIPKPLSIVRGSSGQLNIKLISTANIDDRVWVNITTTGISATSAVDLTWFNRTAVLVEVPSKATVYVPFGVTVPSVSGTGYKTFKNNAKSLGFNATSVDTGMVNVKP